MKYFIMLFFLLTSLMASKLEVTADNFYHKEGEQKAVFSGNVIVTQEQNKITADTITVLLDEKGEAKEYIATGKVHFTLKSPKRDVVGTCDKLTYYPIEDQYVLEGNVYMKDRLNDREVFGDEVIIDNKKGTSYANSKGKKKVKFIFKVKSK